MRTLADIIGSIIFAIGAMAILAACFIMATVAVSIGVPYFCVGVIMTSVGWLISSAASRKKCPTCAKSVKAKALKCKICGHDFLATPSLSIAEPWGMKGH